MSAFAQPPSRPLRTDFSVVDTGFLSDTYKKARKAAGSAYKQGMATAKKAVKKGNEWYEKGKKGLAAAREAIKDDKKDDDKKKDGDEE